MKKHYSHSATNVPNKKFHKEHVTLTHMWRLNNKKEHKVNVTLTHNVTNNRNVKHVLHRLTMCGMSRVSSNT